MVEPLNDHVALVIVNSVGTLQEPVPVSITPPALPNVLIAIPVTGDRDIGFVIPDIVKLNVPDACVVNKLVSVTNCEVLL